MCPCKQRPTSGSGCPHVFRERKWGWVSGKSVLGVKWANVAAMAVEWCCERKYLGKWYKTVPGYENKKKRMQEI